MKGDSQSTKHFCTLVVAFVLMLVLALALLLCRLHMHQQQCSIRTSARPHVLHHFHASQWPVSDKTPPRVLAPDTRKYQQQKRNRADRPRRVYHEPEHPAKRPQSSMCCRDRALRVVKRCSKSSHRFNCAAMYQKSSWKAMLVRRTHPL